VARAQITFVDAHCHLDDEQFSADREAVVARAQDAGVGALITAGADLASSRAAVALAERYTIVYAVVGIHPHYAATFDADARAAIRDLATSRKVVGIGEIGLDFHYADAAPRDLQARVFQAQLDLAAELGKPVVIHNRDADDALMDVLRQRVSRARGILHCFSGDVEMARAAIAQGWLISLAGNVTFRNAPRVCAVATTLPLEHLVIETDAPYLAPARGKRNEPANVAQIAAHIAALRHIEPSQVARQTTQNCQMLFGLPIGEDL
jgi:TatD DNase family protein